MCVDRHLSVVGEDEGVTRVTATLGQTMFGAFRASHIAHGGLLW